MKFIYTFCVVISLVLNIQAQGIDFFEGDWKAALEEAKKTNKLIFVDAYTTWCGPCKRMAKDVFTDEEVGTFYNKNFVNMKIDMEKAAGLNFKKKYVVRAYPTLYYIDGAGEVVHVVKGGRQTKDFINLGKMAMRKNDKSGDYEAEYQKGKRDYDLVFNYVKALNAAGKPSLKVANDYLNTQEDLTSKRNLAFILEAVTEADSRIFDLLLENRSAIEKEFGAEAVKEKVEAACIKTAEKAVAYNYFDLIKEAAEKYRKFYPNKADAFYQSEAMIFYAAQNEKEAYLNAAEELGKIYKKEPALLNKLVQTLLKHYPKDKNALKLAEKWAKNASSSGTEIAYYFTYISVLKQLDKNKEMLKVAKKALTLTDDKQQKRALEKLIEQAENKKS